MARVGSNDFWKDWGFLMTHKECYWAGGDRVDLRDPIGALFRAAGWVFSPGTQRVL